MNLSASALCSKLLKDICKDICQPSKLPLPLRDRDTMTSRSRRSSIAAVHCRPPCVSRGCGASVAQSARFRHGVSVAAHVQATPEDCTVRKKLLNTGCFRRLEHLPSHFILFAYNFVRCPCSRSDITPP